MRLRVRHRRNPLLQHQIFKPRGRESLQTIPHHGNTFQYNTAITNVNKRVINNTYVNNSFQKNVNVNRTSFNGGNGGIKAEPNAEQRAAMANAKKEGPTSQQLERQKLASKDKNLLASTNKGKPNQDVIRSFNKNEGVGQGKGAQEVGAVGGAAGAGAGNKPGNLSERQGQGATAGAGAGNKPGNLSERHEMIWGAHASTRVGDGVIVIADFYVSGLTL